MDLASGSSADQTAYSQALAACRISHGAYLGFSLRAALVAVAPVCGFACSHMTRRCPDAGERTAPEHATRSRKSKATFRTGPTLARNDSMAKSHPAVVNGSCPLTRESKL